MALATRGSEVSRTNREIRTLMNQVLAEYTEMPGLSVTLPQAQQRIVEGLEPSVNCDLEREPDAQPGK